MDIRVRFDVPGREGERRAAVSQMCAELPDERKARSPGSSRHIRELLAHIGQCVQEGTVKRDDFQVCAIERDKERERVAIPG